MERIVLDTNVYVSHLLAPAGLPARIFSHWRALAFHLIVSPAILSEVRQTLGWAMPAFVANTPSPTQWWID